MARKRALFLCRFLLICSFSSLFPRGKTADRRDRSAEERERIAESLERIAETWEHRPHRRDRRGRDEVEGGSGGDKQLHVGGCQWCSRPRYHNHRNHTLTEDRGFMRQHCCLFPCVRLRKKVGARAFGYLRTHTEYPPTSPEYGISFIYEELFCISAGSLFGSLFSSLFGFV